MCFEQFWSIYPRRINKAQAVKKYNTARKEASDETIIAGAYEYAQWCARNGTAKEYIAHPATWLNQKRWDNDYRGDDKSQPAKTAGNNSRTSQTSMAISAAIKVAEKKSEVLGYRDGDLALPF